ncbi:hypothetical protein [Caballeronia sp. LjRoot31]|uniref:hypothetical protein n=1 Tax=Caballeronia sp. LjRoot31 TaxID=3342324 RepID=UPI003ED16922
MQVDIIQSALMRLKNHGFDLRLSPALAAGTRRDQECRALGAAAELLYDVVPEAFAAGGSWAALGRHVRTHGLRNITEVEAADLPLTAFETTAVNAAISLAVKLVALATLPAE